MLCSLSRNVLFGWRTVSLSDTSIRSLAAHLRVSEEEHGQLKLKIARSKVQQKPFLQPTLDSAELDDPLASDDPRRFFPVLPANSQQNTFVTYDPMLDRFICTLMENGDKKKARELVEKSFTLMKHMQLRKLRKQTPEQKVAFDPSTMDPLRILYRAIENSRPVLRLEAIHRGGILYQVPVPVTKNWSYSKAIRWIIESCEERDRKAALFHEALAEELLASGVNGDGKAVRKKQDLHRKCEQNRAYAHFRW